MITAKINPLSAKILQVTLCIIKWKMQKFSLWKLFVICKKKFTSLRRFIGTLHNIYTSAITFQLSNLIFNLFT